MKKKDTSEAARGYQRPHRLRGPVERCTVGDDHPRIRPGGPARYRSGPARNEGKIHFPFFSVSIRLFPSCRKCPAIHQTKLEGDDDAMVSRLNFGVIESLIFSEHPRNTQEPKLARRTRRSCKAHQITQSRPRLKRDTPFGISHAWYGRRAPCVRSRTCTWWRNKQIYFVDAQVRGAAGGEDGVVIRCNLDGTEVEIAHDEGMSDPRVRPVVVVVVVHCCFLVKLLVLLLLLAVVVTIVVVVVVVVFSSSSSSSLRRGNLVALFTELRVSLSPSLVVIQRPHAGPHAGRDPRRHVPHRHARPVRHAGKHAGLQRRRRESLNTMLPLLSQAFFFSTMLRSENRSFPTSICVRQATACADFHDSRERLDPETTTRV